MTTGLTRATFERRLGAAGLGDRAPLLAALARPGLRLRSDGTDTDLLGGSRVGGLPDLPADTAWPAWRETPMSFLGQVDLGSLPDVGDRADLPAYGLLTFFYDAGQQAWGFDPAQTGAWAVLHTAADATLVRREAPAGLPEDARFDPVPLAAEDELCPEPWESRAVERLGLTADEAESYAELLEEMAESDDEPRHLLLGHPDPVQGEMQLECQLVSHGLYCGDQTGYEDSRASALEGGADDWRLLLQVDTDDDASMMWGDAGRLYFWVTEDALRRRAWDEVHLVLQCG
jgi:uncharacterized protein YwqG